MAKKHHPDQVFMDFGTPEDEVVVKIEKKDEFAIKESTGEFDIFVKKLENCKNQVLVDRLKIKAHLLLEKEFGENYFFINKCYEFVKEMYFNKQLTPKHSKLLNAIWIRIFENATSDFSKSYHKYKTQEMSMKGDIEVKKKKGELKLLIVKNLWKYL